MQSIAPRQIITLPAKTILKSYGIRWTDVAELAGVSQASIKSVWRTKDSLYPAYWSLAVFLSELERRLPSVLNTGKRLENIFYSAKTAGFPLSSTKKSA